jgi:hypothetical protein
MTKVIQAKQGNFQALCYNSWAPLEYAPGVVPATVAQPSTNIQGVKPLGLNYKITHISYTVSNWEVVPPVVAPVIPPVGPTPVPLATAAAYAGLAGSTVTNTGTTVLNGDLGLTPGSAIVGAPTVTGATNVDNPAAVTAQNDNTTAYNNAAGRAGAIAIPADIGGTIIAPGLYAAATSLGITGTVTLNGGGNPNSYWIFQVPTALTTATGSVVLLENGANAYNIFWQVGSSATLGVGSTFEGTILALTSITVDTGTTATGRLLARNGALTLDTNVVTVPPTPAPPAPAPPYGLPTGGNFAPGVMGFNIVMGPGSYEGAGASSSYAYATVGGVFQGGPFPTPGDIINIVIAGVTYRVIMNSRFTPNLTLVAQGIVLELSQNAAFTKLYKVNSLGAEFVVQTLAYSTETPSFSVNTNSAFGTVTASGAAMVAGVAGNLPTQPVSDTTYYPGPPSLTAVQLNALFPVDIILPLFNASQADLAGCVYAIENFDAIWPTDAELTLRITTDGVVAGGLNVILWGVPVDNHRFLPATLPMGFQINSEVL